MGPLQPIRKKVFIGELEATGKNNSNTPSLNYWSSFNVDFHGHTIACYKLQIDVVQRLMNIVMTKS
jgi:hypothetical protein